MPRFAAAIVASVLVGGIAAGLVFLAADADSIVRDLATTLAVPVAAWAGIFAAEMMIRTRQFDSAGLLAPGGVYPQVRVVNFLAFLLLTGVGFGLSSATFPGLTWQGFLWPLIGIAPDDPLADERRRRARRPGAGHHRSARDRHPGHPPAGDGFAQGHSHRLDPAHHRVHPAADRLDPDEHPGSGHRRPRASTCPLLDWSRDLDPRRRERRHRGALAARRGRGVGRAGPAVAGIPAATVDRIHLAVDAVLDTVDEAVAAGAQLLVVHHPLLLRGVTSVAEDRYKGAVIARLIRGGCALVAAHTNADIVARGTSAVLAERLGLIDTRPIVPGDGPGPRTRAGRTARHADHARSAGTIARRPAAGHGIRGQGRGGVRPPDRDRRAVRRGGRFAALASRGRRRRRLHHERPAASSGVRGGRERPRRPAGPALIDVSHWASEWLWLEVAAEQLRAALPGVEVTVSELRTDPWDFAILQ